MSNGGEGNNESNVVPLHRPLHPRDIEAIDQATRDIVAACRSAYLLVSEARRRLGLTPPPSMD